MRVENGIVAFEFDAKTGSLLAVEDKRTRVRHCFEASYARLFRVCVPDEERWIDRYADSHESGKPQMKPGKGVLTIRYPNLRTPDGESTGVSATVTVTLPDGAYLDVFAVVPADECYHPRHPMTRRECLAERARCFEIIRDLEGIVSSEEPVDYAIPHLDLVHYAPYVIMDLFLDRDDVAPPAIPLWNLVYHDALFIPWIATPGEWADGIPEGESHAAHAALHGGMPYLDIEPDDAEIERVRELTELHSLVALEEMVEHEFLNDEQTLQRAVYSNGVSVTADVSTGGWEIKR